MGRGRKIWQVAGKLIAIVKYEKREGNMKSIKKTLMVS